MRISYECDIIFFISWWDELFHSLILQTFIECVLWALSVNHHDIYFLYIFYIPGISLVFYTHNFIYSTPTPCEGDMICNGGGEILSYRSRTYKIINLKWSHCRFIEDWVPRTLSLCGYCSRFVSNDFCELYTACRWSTPRPKETEAMTGINC